MPREDERLVRTLRDLERSVDSLQKIMEVANENLVAIYKLHERLSKIEEN